MSLADRFEAFLLDLDGVVWRGDRAIPGAAETVAELREANKRVVFVTNNASRTPRDFAAKLMRMHMPTQPSDVVTSAHAVIERLRAFGLQREARVHVFGTTGLGWMLRGQGFTPTEETHDVDALVVAWNPMATFDDLRRASDVARSGVPFIGANRDATYPTEDGLLPGTGAILAAIETASGKTATVVGKPQPGIIRVALQRAGTPPERSLFVGDRADSDIAGARAAGVPVALVLTGVTGEADLRNIKQQPDFILSSIADLVEGEAPQLIEPGSVEAFDFSAPAASVAPEREDQDDAREESADVREISDARPLVGPGPSESRETSEDLNDEP